MGKSGRNRGAAAPGMCWVSASAGPSRTMSGVVWDWQRACGMCMAGSARRFSQPPPQGILCFGPALSPASCLPTACPQEHLVGSRRLELGNPAATAQQVLGDGVREVEGEPPAWYGHSHWRPHDLRGGLVVRMGRERREEWRRRLQLVVPQNLQASCPFNHPTHPPDQLCPIAPACRSWARTAPCLLGGKVSARSSAAGGTTRRRRWAGFWQWPAMRGSWGAVTR